MDLFIFNVCHNWVLDKMMWETIEMNNIID